MERNNALHRIESLKLGFTLKELGIFLLLLFLNLKFVSIIIIDDRSKIIDLAVYFLLIATFNYSNWTYKSLLKTGFVIGIYTLINFSPYKLNILMPLLLIQSVSGIRFTKYLIINFIITGITLLVMYFVYREGTNWVGYNFGLDRKIRMTFGFNTPNVAAVYYYCFIINGMLLVYFSKFKKYIPLYLLLIIPLWFYVYNKTLSRSFLLSIVILYTTYSYYFIGTIINKKSFLRVSGYFYITLVFIFSAITVFFAFFRENFVKLDLLLSNRLRLYDWFLNKLTLVDFFFGSTAYKQFTIDSSYLHLLFEGGVLYFIGFCVFYVLATVQMVNKKVWIPICIIMSFMAYGMMETLLLYSMLIGTNLFWVILYYYYKNGKMRL